MVSQEKGYSLWLCPPRGGSIDMTAIACITNLAATLSTPIFRGHITLLGDISPTFADANAAEMKIQVAEAVQAAAAAIGVNKLKLRLQPYASPMDEGTDVWHMCVLQWLDTEDDLLSRLRQETITRLGTRVETRPFRPHMSLVYAVVPYAQRQQLATKVSTEVLSEAKSHDFEVSSVILIEHPVPAGPQGITEWREIAEIPLSVE